MRYHSGFSTLIGFYSLHSSYSKNIHKTHFCQVLFKYHFQKESPVTPTRNDLY